MDSIGWQLEIDHDIPWRPSRQLARFPAARRIDEDVDDGAHGRFVKTGLDLSLQRLQGDDAARLL